MFFIGTPKSGPSSLGQGKGKGHLLLPALNALPNAAQDTRPSLPEVHVVGSQSAHCPPGQRGPSELLELHSSQPVGPKLVLVPGVIPSQAKGVVVPF